MKKYEILSHLYFLVLACVSLFFANTIACTGENALEIFILLNPGESLGMNVFTSDYFHFALCKLAVDWGASLQWVVYISVLANILYVYICYLFVSRVFKQPILGFAIILLSLGMSEIFIQQSALMYRYLLNCILMISIIVYLLNLKNRKVCTYVSKVSNGIKGIYALVFLLICLFFLRYLPIIEPTLYNLDIATWGVNVYANGFAYLVGNVMGHYFFVFVLLAYVCVFYFSKKDYIRLAFLLLYPLFFGILALHKQGALYYEGCFLPFIAVLVFWFSRDILWHRKTPKVWFYIVVVLLLVSFSNFIRTALKYQYKEAYFSIIQDAIKDIPAQRIDGQDCELNMRRLEGSSIPHIEFLLYSSLSGHKPYVFIFPKTKDIEKLPTLHTKYFQFKSDGGTNKSDKDIINTVTGENGIFYKAAKDLVPYHEVLFTDCDVEILYTKQGGVSFLGGSANPYSQYFQAYVQSADTAYEGKYSAKVFNTQTFGMEISIPVKEYDKLQVSIKRLGSNNGYLIASDKNKNTFFVGANNPIPFGEGEEVSAWKSLSIDTIIPAGTNFIVVYVMNNSTDLIYFDNLKIRLLRQCSFKDAERARAFYLKPGV